MGNPADSPSIALNRRKEGHIDACLDDAVDRAVDSFDGLKLRYNALPELSRADVVTETTFAGRGIRAPIIVSAMTGGAGARPLHINRNLAQGAEVLGLPLGLGSMKVLLRDDGAAASFMVRDLAPSVPVIANLGLVSFNYGLEWSDVARLIETVRPDAFAFHLNALQESIQLGGDTDFSGLKERLAELIERCPIPVYVKECGGGISPELVHEIAAMGADYIDVSGNDGTSWASVEARLGPDPEFGELFRDFGLPTRWILERTNPDQLGPTTLVAGGGIRNGVQAAKAIALGAGFVSIARPFLTAALESPDAVVAAGSGLIDQLRTAMFLSGAGSIEALNRRLLIDVETSPNTIP